MWKQNKGMSKLNRELLKLAIPNIISNISLPLLSTVDTALMGHLSGLYLGAIGLGAMIFNFFYWNFGFLRMSTTGFVAQSFGAKDASQIIGHLARALIVALILALLILSMQSPIINISLQLLNASSEQIPLIMEYYGIRIWAAPASLCLFVFLGWFFGMQNSRIPLVLTIIINITNIAMSSYLVLVKEMGIAGAAYGTIIAQYVGIITAIFFLLYFYRDYLHHLKKEAIFKIKAYGRFFVINRDIFLRTISLTLAFGFFYSQSAAAGALVLAANVVLIQFLNWMSYGIDGFAYAAESLVGKYHGAKDRDNTRRAIRYSFYWGAGLAILYAVLYGFGGYNLLYIFTDDPDVIQAADKMLIWMFWVPIIGFACYIWDGVFIGLTASKAMRNTMFLALAFYLLSWYLLADNYPIHGLWGAFLIFLGARGLFQSLWFNYYGLQLK